MKKSLSINNLTKKYESFELKNINIDIPLGSIVGFIGENGAGKTTTIKSILNLINIDSGTIKIFEKDFQKNEREIKEDIGVVLDNSFMPEQLTPIDINSIMKKIYTKWDEKKYYNYIERFSLPQNKKIKDYSTGMLIKLKITVALSHHPKLLILDEPTSGLDPIARRDVLDIFEEFISDNKHSIFVSSHITSDLEQVADYIIFINNGRIVLSKEKKELFNKYGIIKCSEDAFKKIDLKDIVRYKKNRKDYEILIENVNEFKKKYKNSTIDNATLDDIMLLFIRGEENE